ncbi:MAG: hypothetical protein ACTIJ6_00080 [Leucobacter sp.]
MGSGGLGGGVMFLAIALLWGAVLVPAWFRRREFNVAERNALRLQRTLRVLAETAELPDEVRIQATAREALAHERMLRTTQKREEAEREAELAAARSEQVRAEIRAQQMQRKQVAMNRAAKLHKPIVRRMRSLAALIGLLGFVGALMGAGMMIAGIGPAVLLWSLLAFTVGFGTLVLIAPGRAKLEPIAAEQEVLAEAPMAATSSTDEERGEREDSVLAHQHAQQSAAQRIQRARTLARSREIRAAAPRENQHDSILLREVREQAARAHQDAAAATATASAAKPVSVSHQARSSKPAAPATPTTAAPTPATPTPAAVPGGFSQLGVVGDTSEGMPDLDQVMRRRRTAG